MRHLLSLTNLSACVIAAALLAQCRPAAAQLVIDFVPLDQTTNPLVSPGELDEDPHVLDPSSDRLLTILEHVGDVFEDVFEDGHTIEITYLWDDDADFAGQAPPDMVAETDGMITHGVVRFHPTAATWFIDDTPAGDGEFDPLEQVLYGSLGLSDQLDRFAGDVPWFFEAGFNASSSGAPATGSLDLLTVAFQEVGHAIGLSSGFSGLTNGEGTGEADDGEWDVPPEWVDGEFMDIRPILDGSNGPFAHLAGNDAVMASLGNSERTRPSTADYMAIAITNGWEDIDLPRKDFVAASGDWRLGSRWLGGAAPDIEDDVFIRNGGNVTMFINTMNVPSARNLTIQNDSTLSTDDSMLIVTNDILIEAGPMGTSATLNVDQDGHVDADDVTINDGGLVNVTSGDFLADVFAINSGGQINVAGVETDTLLDVALLDINGGGNLLGHGDVMADDIHNNGSIIAVNSPSGDRLRLFSDASGFIDLDGGAPFDGTGHLFAQLGDMIIIGAVPDAFDGELTVGQGRSFITAGPWQIGDDVAITDPTVWLLGGNTQNNAATLTGLTGADITAHDGTIHVEGYAAIDSGIEFDSGIEVHVDEDGFLVLNGSATFNGGSYTGAGTIVFEGETLVESATTLQVAYADLDGTTISGDELTITSGAVLTVQSDHIDGPGLPDQFDGIMNINGGFTQFNVQLADPDASWTMNGTLNLNGSGLPVLSHMVVGNDVVVTGTLNVDGVSSLGAANFDVPGEIVTVDFDSQLRFASGEHIIRSTAAVTGPGTLAVTGPATLQLEDEATLAIDTIVSGRIEIGTSIGQATIVGGMDMSPFGTFAVEIAGSPGSGNFDQLAVNETADVDGTLELSLINGYVPSLGTFYTILTGSPVTGGFDDVETYSDSFFDFDVNVTYPGTRVVVEFVDLFIPGDYNDDGLVDVRDYALWRDNMGAIAGTLENDVDGGPIGHAQYATWLAHYGYSLPTPTGLASGVVPEPASGAMLAAALAGLLGWRGRQRTSDSDAAGQVHR